MRTRPPTEPFASARPGTCFCTSFVCPGTVEERIEHVIESKKQLAGDFLEGGADIYLTEMGDEELLKLVALDLGAAMKEGER